MIDKVLLIVEGNKTETNFFRRLSKIYQGGCSFEIVSMSVNIYSFYDKLKNIGFENTTSIEALKEIKKDDIAALKQLDAKFVFTYLVFDFDVQEKNKTLDNKRSIISELLDIFQEETGDFGRLLINYPMAESYRDFPLNNPKIFLSEDMNVNVSKLTCYKKTVAERGNSKDIWEYKDDNFVLINNLNINKAFSLIGKSIDYDFFNSESFLKEVFLKEVYGLIGEEEKVVPICEMAFILIYLYGLPEFQRSINYKI